MQPRPAVPPPPDPPPAVPPPSVPPPPGPAPASPWRTIALRLGAALLALVAGAGALLAWVISGILLSGCFIGCGPPEPVDAVVAGFAAAGAAALAGGAAATVITGRPRRAAVGAATALTGTAGALAVAALAGYTLADHGHAASSWVLIVHLGQVAVGVAAATAALRARGDRAPALAFAPLAQLPLAALTGWVAIAPL